MLRRSRGHLEVILNGAFLISTENDASSRAMVAAALPHLAGDALEVLIGGLGLGYALDEASGQPRVAHVTVAELEPTIVRWFREHGEERARARRRGRARRTRAHRVRRRGRGARRATPAASTSSRWTPTTGRRGWCGTTTPACTRRPACASPPPRCVPAAWPSSGRRTATPASRPCWRRVFAAGGPEPRSTSCRAGVTSTRCTSVWPPAEVDWVQRVEAEEDAWRSPGTSPTRSPGR